MPEAEAPKNKKSKKGEQAEEAPSLFVDKPRDNSLEFGPDYSYKKIRFHKKDEINPYADAQDVRHAMDPRLKKIIFLVAMMLVVFFFSATLPVNILSPIDHAGYTLAEFFRDFGSTVNGFLAFLTGSGGIYASYVLEIVAAGLAGIALGISGGVYQGAMKNALASPTTLGITSGGTLGCVIYVLFINRNFTGSVSEYAADLSQANPIEYIISIYGEFIASTIGCFLVVSLIMLIALLAGRGKVSNVSLIIAGQVFSTVITVVISWIRYYLTVSSNDANLIYYLTNVQTVSFTGTYTLTSMLVFAIPLLICVAIILLMSRRLTLLAFNDEEARSMGISTRATRNTMVAICTVMTALVISFVGMVGFVGFMVPHIARKFVGGDFKYLLPVSALLGAILVIAVHYISVMGIPGIESGSTGMLTAIVGCVMFLIMALRQRKDTRGDWL